MISIKSFQLYLPWLAEKFSFSAHAFFRNKMSQISNLLTHYFKLNEIRESCKGRITGGPAGIPYLCDTSLPHLKLFEKFTFASSVDRDLILYEVITASKSLVYFHIFNNLIIRTTTLKTLKPVLEVGRRIDNYVRENRCVNELLLCEQL